MRIRQIVFQSRNDFSAIYECEHCGGTMKTHGYDDANFHGRVIPAWHCGECGKNRDGEMEKTGP